MILEIIHKLGWLITRQHRTFNTQSFITSPPHPLFSLAQLNHIGTKCMYNIQIFLWWHGYWPKLIQTLTLTCSFYFGFVLYRISFYLGFVLYRISFYLGFVLDRIHCTSFYIYFLIYNYQQFHQMIFTF
jgi:hypothetical protein